jgi:hypothetical protein
METMSEMMGESSINTYDKSEARKCPTRRLLNIIRNQC